MHSNYNISKAFDTVSHGILLSKLWHFGISDSLWAWFKNYLSNRYQRVSINNNLSHTLPVVSGVPQGSILGPVLFLIYMNDITSSIRHSQLLIYADDTKCLSIFPLLLTRPISRRTSGNAIITWSKSSQLNFNISKCTHISFKPKFVSLYNLSDTAISITDFQKDLGLVVSNNLSWENHYNHITPHAYKILGLIRRSFSPSLNLSVKMKLYLTLVRSQLMYCTPIWCPYLQKDIQNSGIASFTKVEGHKLGLPIRLKDVHLHHSMTFIKDPVMHLVSNITIIIHIIHFLKIKCIVT